MGLWKEGGACEGARNSARASNHACLERGVSVSVVVLNTIFPIRGHLAGS